MDNVSIPPVQQPDSTSGAPVGASNSGGDEISREKEKTRREYEKKYRAGNVVDLVKTIAIIALSLALVTFIGLFAWVMSEYNSLNSDVQGKISVAVAKAKDETAAQKEAIFLEREKNPLRTFVGPDDYGQLTFQYPKTWSVYIADSAANGGDFHAYFNPVQVEAVSNDTVNALRVSIVNKLFDVVAAEYQKAMEKKDSNLTMESVTVNGFSANRYTGTIPNTDLSGYIIIFKIRDKTAIVQTDSVLFADDYNKLIETITFSP